MGIKLKSRVSSSSSVEPLDVMQVKKTHQLKVKPLQNMAGREQDKGIYLIKI